VLRSEYELKQEAISYIRTQLASGRAFAHALLKLPLETGRVTAYLPPDISEEALYDFGSGGIACGQENLWLAEFISKTLSVQPSGICVFEHPVAEQGDSRMPDSPFFAVGRDIFMVAQRDTPSDVVLRIVRDAHWYPAVGALATLPVDQAVPEDESTQSPDLVRQLAEAADHVMIGAYDGEAWLIWSR
jgi:hypothetical protein